MKLLVLPPHRDVTLAPDVPEGWQLLDVARDFCRRVFSWDGEEGHAGLRALDSALVALSGPPSGVRLRLDDLSLGAGTLERSADVLRAASQPAPYAEDLSLALERFSDAERVRLWLEGSAQLPAAVWLARLCPATVPLELAGPFANAHRKVLARMSAFHRASFPQEVPPLRWRVTPLGAEPTPESLIWIPEGLDLGVVGVKPPPLWDYMQLERPHPRDAPGRRTGYTLGDLHPEAVRAFTSGAPWAGHVTLSTVHDEAEALAESGCRLAVVPFCAMKGGAVRGLEHWLHPDRRGLRRAWELGVRVVAEWWVGAPGESEETLRGTLEQLAAVPLIPLFDWVAGVHPFQGGVGRLGESFDYGDPPLTHDLATGRLIKRPGTVSPARLPGLIEELARQLGRRVPLSPGRVAGAYVHIPPTAPFFQAQPGCQGPEP